MKKKSARKKAANKAVSRKRAPATPTKRARSTAKKKGGSPRKRKPLEPENFEIIPMETTAASLLPIRQQESLHAWFQLYMGVEGRAGSENTTKAKTRDLQLFLSFLSTVAGVDHPDQWTRSVTRDFLKRLQKDGKGASTVNRALATLKHTASWIERQRPFLPRLQWPEDHHRHERQRRREPGADLAERPDRSRRRRGGPARGVFASRSISASERTVPVLS